MSLTQAYDFHGKTALITGASGGLGEQFARCLSSAGACVVIAARRIDKLEKLVTELDNAKAIKMDIADKNSVVIRTPMTHHKVGTEEQQKEFASLIPLGFVASPKDLDSALMFLAHNEHSAYMK